MTLHIIKCCLIALIVSLAGVRRAYSSTSAHFEVTLPSLCRFVVVVVVEETFVGRVRHKLEREPAAREQDHIGCTIWNIILVSKSRGRVMRQTEAPAARCSRFPPGCVFQEFFFLFLCPSAVAKQLVTLRLHTLTMARGVRRRRFQIIGWNFSFSSRQFFFFSVLPLF